MTQLDRTEVRQTLQALRDGQVPPRGALDLCVGREEIIRGYEQRLHDTTQGQAAVKFIRGDYGYGKSMLLRVFEEMALDKGFAVAKVSIRSELPFNKLEEFYRKIAREVSAAHRGQGVEMLMRLWVEDIRREVEKEDPALEPFDVNDRVRPRASTRLQEVREVSPGFARGAEAYVEARLTGDPEKAEAAVTWLRQDPHQRAADKALIGVKGGISKENAHEYLQGLLRFVRSVPLAGTVILADEAEYMRLLSQERLRDVAYDNIRALWDGCNHGEIRYALVVFAATGEMFTDQRRGFAAYDALMDRMGLGASADAGPSLDMRWPVVDLPLLRREQVIKLGRRLVQLHSEGENWQASARVDDALLTNVAEQAVRAGALLGGEVRPRDFVRAMIRWLDGIQQHPEASTTRLGESFGSAFEDAVHEEVEEEPPLWSES